MLRGDYLLELIEQLDEVFFIMEFPSLAYKYISPSVVSRGYTQEEVYATPGIMYRYLSAERLQFFLDFVNDSFGKGPFTIEYPIETKTSEVKWYQSTLLLIDEPKEGLLLLGFGRDITNRKNDELEIEKLKSEYVDLYENAPNGYHSLDANGTIVRVNNTELNWLGYTREEMLGRKIQEHFLTPASQRKFAEMYSKLKTEGFINELKLDLVRKDGSVLHCLLNATGERDEHGEIMFTRSILTNIGALVATKEKLRQSQVALKAINSELQLANQKLERLNFTKDVLLKIISHDLRNPLETIKLLSTLLHEKYDELDLEALTKYLEYINETSQSATDILDDMTNMVKFGSEIKLQLSPTDMHSVILEAIAINEKRAAEKGVHLQFENQPTNKPLLANADAKWLVRALDNLLSNALKFSNKDGVIKMSCQQEGKMAVLTIADNGVGIPSNILSQLFTQNVVASRLGTAGEPGTGLGLSIVKQIVEMQAGEIGVTSTEGKGSCFEIRLYLAK